MAEVSCLAKAEVRIRCALPATLFGTTCLPVWMGVPVPQRHHMAVLALR